MTVSRWTFYVAAEEPSRLHVLMHTMRIFPLGSYLSAAETGGNQGGHHDHGHHDLDSGRGVACSHFGCFFLSFSDFCSFQNSI
jgi:hypothetical protein